MYIVSIVIPTRNRYEYLKPALETMVGLNLSQTEIVLQDNSDDNNDFASFIKTLNCPYIRYYYDSRPLSQTQNSDLAVEHSTGKYVCYIGDDDVVTSWLPSICTIMNDYQIEAANFPAANYDWPDLEFKNSIRTRPPFFLELKSIRIKKINSRKILEKYLQQGMQSNLLLPKAYHGVLSREVLNRIKEMSGSYFPGPSPDMANAVAAACVVKRHVFIQLPLIISGVGYKSANGMGRRGAHKGSLNGVRQLATDVEEKWNLHIPKLWIGQTIWPESCSKALTAMGEIGLADKMNWYAMYGRIYLCWDEYRDCLNEYCASTKAKLCVCLEMLRDGLTWLWKRSIKKIRFILHLDYYTYENLTIAEASNRVDSLITKKFGSSETIVNLVRKSIVAIK